MWIRSLPLLVVVALLATPPARAKAASAGPVSPEAPIEISLEEAEPRILLPPPAGLKARDAVRLHGALVDALVKRFGDRVVPTAEVLRAQKKERIFEGALRTPAGVERLAQAVGAERAVFVEVVSGLASVSVYGVLGAQPSHGFDVDIKASLKRKKGAEALAAKIAEELDARAKKTLGRREVLPLVEAEKPPEPPQAEEPAGEGGMHPDILAELERERKLREVKKKEAERPRAPSLALTLGGGLGLRDLTVEGPLKARLLPVEHGALPAVSARLSVFPLRFVPAWNHAWFSDLELSVEGRRAFLDALWEGSSCPVDDDGGAARLSYRVPVAGSPFAPRLGGGLGGGWERTEIGCPLPAPSARYAFADVHLAAAQPLVPEHLELNALVAGRFIFTGPGERVPTLLSPEASLFVTGHLPPLLYARAGGRLSHVGVEREGAFTTSDLRASFVLEAGAYF